MTQRSSKRPVRAASEAKSALKPSTKKSAKLNEQVAHQLGIDIVANRYPPGSTLPTEAQASSAFGVSRTAYREALRILASKGLISSRPKTGTLVNPRSRWIILDPQVLGWMFESKPSVDFVRGIFELRQLIEPAAAALAAERRSAQQLSVMGHALEEMARRGINSAAGQQADEAFHDMLLQATGNEALAALTNSISFAIRWTTSFTLNAGKPVHDPLPRHRALFGALVDGDADRAREAAKALIDDALDNASAALSPARVR